MKKFIYSLLLMAGSIVASGQSFTLPGDGSWYLVATKGGRHAIVEYTYSHSTAHNPSITRGKIQFINAKTFLIQDHQTMGYNAWNQPQFAVINKGNSSELWVKATPGVNAGLFEITYSKYATLVLGITSDADLSDNGGSLKVYDKLPDNSHNFVGDINLIDGDLRIGTTTSGSHKVAVEGSIGAREVQVEASGWSDFVFEPDYKLRTLQEVEQHISDQGHLPEIPSEAEVMENGINLGEMDARLLQKIEELTLYMINLNKRVDQLESENQALKIALSNRKQD